MDKRHTKNTIWTNEYPLLPGEREWVRENEAMDMFEYKGITYIKKYQPPGSNICTGCALNFLGICNHIRMADACSTACYIFVEVDPLYIDLLKVKELSDGR